MNPKILIVDDDSAVVDSLERYMAKRIIADVLTANDGYKAIDILRGQKIDVLVLDISMPGISGREVAEEARRLNDKMDIIVVTGWDCGRLSDSLKELNAQYMPKPVAVDVIFDKIKECLVLRGLMVG